MPETVIALRKAEETLNIMTQNLSTGRYDIDHHMNLMQPGLSLVHAAELHEPDM